MQLKQTAVLFVFVFVFVCVCVCLYLYLLFSFLSCFLFLRQHDPKREHTYCIFQSEEIAIAVFKGDKHRGAGTRVAAGWMSELYER